ncbi:MAG: ferrous iron transport protein A [Sandaracinaceae bacterium]
MSAEVTDVGTLADVPVGAEATIVRVRCERPVARRLMEMGLLPGTSVAVVRVAPLGDPVVLRVRGYSLSIRRKEAASIAVEGVRESVTAPASVRRTAS